MNRRGNLIIVAAPSGAGKTSLVNRLVESIDEVKISISYTTRSPRPNDEHGKDYFFVDEAQFSEMVKSDTFLEHAEVFGNHYGTSNQWVLTELAAGQDVILEIDWQGAKQIRQQFPEALAIYILPPSLAVLRERLLARRQDSESTIEARMALAQNEMSHYGEFDYLIVNDDFDLALEQFKHIVLAGRSRVTTMSQTLAPLLADLLKKQ